MIYRKYKVNDNLLNICSYEEDLYSGSPFKSLVESYMLLLVIAAG